MKKFIALVPARSGSKRIIDKNIQFVSGRSLIERTVISAQACERISDTYIVTDSPDYEKLAISYSCKSLGLRPINISTAFSSDIEWLKWACQRVLTIEDSATHYIILRPTSPFRSACLISHAIQSYLDAAPSSLSTLRSVSRVKEHPGKMWVEVGCSRMARLLPLANDNVFWSDCQSAVLPSIFVQNACIEIGCISTVLDRPSSSTHDTIFFQVEGHEAFDINTPLDLEISEFLASKYGI
jgi:CMP-N,N'-diacetyllegionaminic acid synthase